VEYGSDDDGYYSEPDFDYGLLGDVHTCQHKQLPGQYVGNSDGEPGGDGHDCGQPDHLQRYVHDPDGQWGHELPVEHRGDDSGYLGDADGHHDLLGDGNQREQLRGFDQRDGDGEPGGDGHDRGQPDHL
jgi:hypothetical protein